MKSMAAIYLFPEVGCNCAIAYNNEFIVLQMTEIY